MTTSLSALRRVWFAVLIVAITNAGCTSKTKPDDTFMISGIVRSSADQTPLEAAIVQASGTGASGVWIARSVLTDAAGHYVITGLRDSVTMTVTKGGFLTATANLLLTQDTPLDFTMGKGVLDGAADLVVNQTVSGSIAASDVKCDPQWDRNSPCLRLSFLAPTLRVYQFVLTFDCAELELHLFGTNGSRLFNISKASPITRDIALAEGVYEVRLMAYYSCNRFDLTVK